MAESTASTRRILWVLGPLFAVVGLVAGGLIMHGWLTRTQVGRDATRRPLPANNAGRPANAPELMRDAFNAPPANATTPAANENPPPPQDPAPGPQPEPEAPAVMRARAQGDARLLQMRKGAAEYLKAADGLAAGDRLRVDSGEARLQSGFFAAVLTRRGEVEALGVKSLRLMRGRLVLRVLMGLSVEAADCTLALAPGEYVIASEAGVFQAEVLNGLASVSRKEARAEVAPGMLVVLSGQLQQLPMSAQEHQARVAEAEAMVHTLLRWDFEEGYGDCNLGKLIEGGLGGGRALQWDTTQAGAGTALRKPLFVARAGARLRAWVDTPAAHVDITMLVHLPQGPRKAALRVPAPPGEGWRMIDVALEGLRGGAVGGAGFIEGAEYSSLQFSVPPTREERLTAKPLSIDAVQVYTLE